MCKLQKCSLVTLRTAESRSTLTARRFKLCNTLLVCFVSCCCVVVDGVLSLLTSRSLAEQSVF